MQKKIIQPVMRYFRREIERMLEEITPDWELMKVEGEYFIIHSKKNDEKHVVCYAPIANKKQILNDLSFIAHSPEIISQLLDEHKAMKEMLEFVYKHLFNQN